MKKREKLFISEPQDRVFFLETLLLLSLGLIMLLSASYPAAMRDTGSYTFYFRHQVMFAVLGLIAMGAASRLNYHLLRYLGIWLILASFAALIAVLIPGIGVLRNNARRWISVFGSSFQPSELAKLAVIIDFSASIAWKKDLMQGFRYGILPYLLKLIPLCLLILAEPHLSGAIILAGIGVSLMIIGGVDKKWILGGVLLAAGFAWLLFSGKISYGQSRIAMWRDPFIDATGDGYQLSQSIITIGSGGWFGQGLGKSRQKHLFLPEAHNDFIFSVVCEELGFCGAVLILLLFAAVTLRGFRIALAAKDRFGSLLAAGVSTHIALQTFMNVGVVTGLLPTAGISLPFFSYGGTALVFQLAEMGIVLSVSRQGKELSHRRKRKDETS